MDILVACEESQAVTIELRKLGHEAYSCDILSCSGGHPEWHIQEDVTPILDKAWDMIIAFPPCTDLAVSGARYFAAKRADGRQQRAIDFFMTIANADCPRIAIENPVGIMSSVWRKPDQIIQPYDFGHDASKSTCLWLKGLERLEPTGYVRPHHVCKCNDRRTVPFFCPTCKSASRRVWGNQTKSGQNKLGPSPERARLRSKTYEGVAKAMASQWSGDINASQN